ncbi:MAG TPA: glycosyltransferase [Candidatus Didemnitutus sp.]|nr:glycosyltransferase [Candidatus Didemnitutus sp.]
MKEIAHHLDQTGQLRADDGLFRLLGWAMLDDGAAVNIRLRLANDSIFDCRSGLERLDVAAAFPDRDGAATSGFSLTTYLPPGLQIGNLEYRREQGDWRPFRTLSILVGVSPLQCQLESGFAPAPDDAEFFVNGWCFHPQSEITRLTLQFGPHECEPVMCLARPDVAALFPDARTAGLSGFRGHVPVLAGSGPLRLTAHLASGEWVRHELHPGVTLPDHAAARARFDAAFARASLLDVPGPENPAVSIVIPIHNQIELTLACLESLTRCPAGAEYEVIIVDDASAAMTRDCLGAIRGARIVSQEQNQGFLRSCNRGAAAARGEFVVLLNNDTEVSGGWLKAMLDTFAQRPAAGLVGAKLVYPDGTLQEAGGILWADGSAWNYGRGQDAARPEFNYVRETDYCSGACIMLPAELWRQLGGFDEHFAPAYCEDSDLAMRVRAAGKKVYYQPAAVITHHEGRSNGTDVGSGLKKYQVLNSEKLRARWASVLAAEHRPNGVDVFRARERSFKRKVILFIDHYLPHYDRDAGSRTIWAYLQFFVDQDFSVKFMGDNFHPHEPYLTEMQQKGIEVLHGPWYAEHWERWLEEAGSQIDYVLLSRAHISPRYIGPIRRTTRAQVLFYGHDLVSRSMEREFAMTGNQAVLESAAKWRAMEENVFKEVDVAYYPSDDEVRYLAEHYPSLVARVLPPYVYKEPPKNGFSHSVAQRGGLLFVGGFNHPPNADAMLWFHRTAWPVIRRNFPALRLTIAGSNPPSEILDLADAQVTVTGYVTEEELNQLYASHLLAVIPLRFGGGVKGKIVEALWHGLPVLTTAVGAEGIPDAASCLCISTLDDFADNLQRLLRSPDTLAEMVAAGGDVIARHYSSEALHDAYSQDICLS